MMMLVMGAGFQFSSLTSGVVGQSVTAGDQQQSHYSSIVTQAQSTTQNNAHRHYTKQHTTNTRTVYSMEHTQSSTSTAHKRKGETSTVCIIYCHTAHRHTQNNTTIKHKNSTQHTGAQSTAHKRTGEHSMPHLLSHRGLRHILDTCSRPTNNTFSLQQSHIRLSVFFCDTYCFSSVPNIAPENQRNCLFDSKL